MLLAPPLSLAAAAVDAMALAAEAAAAEAAGLRAEVAELSALPLNTRAALVDLAAAVMTRVQDLRRSLDTLVGDMAEGRGAHWAAFLDRLAVINVQHMQIASQLRPLLRQYVAFPKFIDAPQARGCSRRARIEADVPSLLASRLLPDQEAEEAEAKAQLLGTSQQPELVLAAAEQQLEGLRAAVAVLFSGDPAALAATGVLDPKGPQRKALDAASGQIQKAIADQQAARARSGAAAAAGPAPPGGARGAAAAAAAAAGQKRSRGGGAVGGGGGGGAAGGGTGDAAAEEQLLRDLASGAAYRRAFTTSGGGAGGGAAAK
ncbi:MAG: hypothetical protein J3K34DRAFT_519931 [Monoraphidium minutum]|nr:MAG: hypothetical protein J3K34DRAFT_519931 [Monoraphidium minutum]